MTYPLVQFVSAPTEGAEVRFDFNEDTWADEETWPEHDGFSLGAPSLEGDPDGVGVEYGFRELSFNLLINAPRQAALARQSALAREILRQTNWLRFQLDEFSRPVWFKTYRTAPGELSFEHVYTERASDLWGLGVSLVADPFAYGERVTLPTVTINNDPAAATNPMSYALPEIAGDAPTPLRVEVVPNTPNNPNATVRLARAGAVATYWHVGTDDGNVWSALNGTGAAVADATFTGGSYRPITFTNPALVGRLSGTPPQPSLPGRYAIMARLARSDTSSKFTVQGSQVISLTKILGPVVPFAPDAGGSAKWASWVHLGDFSFPVGLASADGAGDLPPNGPGSTFQLAAARTEGTGELWIDNFLLVPVSLLGGPDSRTLTADYSDTPLGFVSSRCLYDGDTETYLEVFEGGTWDGTVWDTLPPVMAGGFPDAHPGEANVLHFMLQMGGMSPLGNPDSITATTTVHLSYRPRHLWIGGE